MSFILTSWPAVGFNRVKTRNRTSLAASKFGEISCSSLQSTHSSTLSTSSVNGDENVEITQKVIKNKIFILSAKMLIKEKAKTE